MNRRMYFSNDECVVIADKTDRLHNGMKGAVVEQNRFTRRVTVRLHSNPRKLLHFMPCKLRSLEVGDSEKSSVTSDDNHIDQQQQFSSRYRTPVHMLASSLRQCFQDKISHLCSDATSGTAAETRPTSDTLLLSLVESTLSFDIIQSQQGRETIRQSRPQTVQSCDEILDEMEESGLLTSAMMTHLRKHRVMQNLSMSASQLQLTRNATPARSQSSQSGEILGEIEGSRLLTSAVMARLRQHRVMQNRQQRPLGEDDEQQQAQNKQNSHGLLPEEINKFSRQQLHCMQCEQQSLPATCAICLESYKYDDNVRTISCFHNFHTHCIDPWLAHKAECPLCKFPVGVKSSSSSSLPLKE